MNGKALVTGGAGFIGSRVCRRLLDAGFEVHVYDSFVAYLPPDPKAQRWNFAARLEDIFDHVRIVRGSTLDKDDLRRCLLDLRPDVIVHMAAMPLAALAIEHTEEALNSIVHSTHNVLEVLRDFDHACRLVYVSSSMVYGDFDTETVDEEHPRRPKDIYGALKLAGEVIVTAYARTYGLDAVICRPSAVYGPFDGNRRVVQKLIAAALAGEPMTLDGDGSMRLDFTHVDDCALGIRLCATHPAASGGIFNVTRGEARSLLDLAEIVGREIPGARVKHRDAPAYMPRRGTLSIARARRELGYEPCISLEEGVRRYVAHLRAHPF